MKVFFIVLFFALLLGVGLLGKMIPDLKMKGRLRKSAAARPKANAPVKAGAAFSAPKAAAGAPEKPPSAKIPSMPPPAVGRPFPSMDQAEQKTAVPSAAPSDQKSAAAAPTNKPEPQKTPEQLRDEAIYKLRKTARRDLNKDPEWQDFWQNRFPALPEEIKPEVYYEGCVLQADIGVSGMHFGGNPYAPISFLGYPTLGDAWFGVAFRINTACFGKNKDVTLFYTDQDIVFNRVAWKRTDGDPFDHPPYWDGTWTGMIETVRRFSSGIGEVTLCSAYDPDQIWDKPMSYLRIRLDPEKIKETVELSRRQVPTAEFGGYALVIPRLGEYNCTLGEINRRGKRIPLLHDSFCLK